MVWGVVLVFVIGSAILLDRVGASGTDDRIDTFGAPVAIIGSSLIRDAVPEEPVEGGVLGDGRAHVRLWAPTISERTSLKFLDAAITGGAETIFLEISAFSFDFNESFLEGRAEKRPVTARFDVVRDFSDRVDLGIQRIGALFLPEEPVSIEHIDPLDEYDGVPDRKYTVLFPLHRRDPIYDDELKEQVDRAKARGAEVIFVSPPRAAAVQSFMGTGEYDALIAQQRKIAAEYGVPLIALGPFWPDDHFRDMTHPNFRGSDRFLSELAAWLEARP